MRLHTRDALVLISSPWAGPTDSWVTHSTSRCSNSLAACSRPFGPVSLTTYVNLDSGKESSFTNPYISYAPSCLCYRSELKRYSVAACLWPPRTPDNYWAPALCKEYKRTSRAKCIPVASLTGTALLPGCHPAVPISSSPSTPASPSFPHEGAQARLGWAVPAPDGCTLPSGPRRVLERDEGHRPLVLLLQAVPALRPGGPARHGSRPASRPASRGFRPRPRPPGQDQGAARPSA